VRSYFQSLDEISTIPEIGGLMNIAKAMLAAALLLNTVTETALFGQSRLPPVPADSPSTLSGEVIMVSLPSEVFLLNKSVPAGEYHIRLDAARAALTLVFTSSSNRAEYEVPASIILTQNVRPAEKTEVVLERVGTSVYLTRIWMQSRSTGYEIGLPERAGDLNREPYQSIPASLFPPPGSSATELQRGAHSVPPEQQREGKKPGARPRDPSVKQ
jgi:hypothetical protein